MMAAKDKRLSKKNSITKSIKSPFSENKLIEDKNKALVKNTEVFLLNYGLPLGGIVVILFLYIVFNLFLLKKCGNKKSFSKITQQQNEIDLLISKRLQNAERNIEGIKLEDNNNISESKLSTNTFPYLSPTDLIFEGNSKETVTLLKNDNTDIFVDYNDNLIKEEIEIVKAEIETSQKSSPFNCLKIPLCVPYEDKELVKSVGANWSPNERTWFWPFTNSREPINKWLPRMYQLSQTPPYILPQLVPEPIWYINLRSLLTSEQWKNLKTKTYENYGYRCCRCGCKGKKWPVECNEIWVYEIISSQKKGIVYFKGLESLCPGCHKIIHIGKAHVDGYEYQALARLVCMNEWTIQEAKKAVIKAFQDWEQRSEIKEWSFNFEILDQKYGVKVPENEYPKLRQDN